jgi:hypothetical protein
MKLAVPEARHIRVITFAACGAAPADASYSLATYSGATSESFSGTPTFSPPNRGRSTHRVILKAMAAGNCVLVRDHQQNAQTGSDVALSAAAYEAVRPRVRLAARSRADGARLRCRMKNVVAVLAAAVMSAPQVACGARASGDGTVAGAACMRTRYLLTVHPATTTSNEQHTLEFRASTDVCGHRAPVRGAGVRLGSYRATTDTHGRARLTVRLQTGRYLVRLFVHGRAVARAHVWAIPIVSSQ